MIQTTDIIKALVESNEQGSLQYDQVKDTASKLGLVLAEFGDCLCPEAHNGAESYAYFNNSGDRNDTQTLLVYYNFDKPDKDGRLTKAGTVKELHIDYDSASGELLFEKLRRGDELCKYQAIQAVRLTGATINEAIYNSIIKRVCSVQAVNNKISVRYDGRRRLSPKVFETFEILEQFLTSA